MRNDRLLGLLASTLVLVLLGCGAPQSVTVSCSAMGATTAKTGQRIALAGFSVAAPDGARWCLFPAQPPGAIGFTTHPRMGQTIYGSESDLANTFALTARSLKLGAIRLNSAEEFYEFAREWVAGGMSFIEYENGTEVTLSDYRDPRFTQIDSKVEVETSLSADCVRADDIFKEINNPINPNMLFILAGHYVICYRASTDYLVYLALTERYERGKHFNPGLFDRFKDEDARTFFESLEFQPL